MSMTTLGHALNRRSDLQKHIAQLQERVRGSVLVQEGDEPPESANELLAELGSHCDELQHLIAQINHTNVGTRLPTGETITEALARRDVLGLRQSALRGAVRAAINDGLPRYSCSEIRMVRQIRVGQTQEQIDALAKQQRDIGTRVGKGTRLRYSYW